MKISRKPLYAIAGVLFLMAIMVLAAVLLVRLPQLTNRGTQAFDSGASRSTASSKAFSASGAASRTSFPAQDLLQLEMGQWRFDPQHGFPDRVLVAGGHVFVTYDDDGEHHATGLVYALDPKTGKVRWHYRFDYPLTEDRGSSYSDPVTATDSPSTQILVIGTHDTVLALDDDTGTLKWRTAVAGTVTSLAVWGAAPGDSDYAIYAGTTSGVYKLYSPGGKSVSNYGYVSVPGRVAKLVLTESPDPELFVATEKPTTVERLDAGNLEVRWKVAAHRYVKSKFNWYPVLGMAWGMAPHAAAVGTLDRLYVAIKNTLLALNASNGTLLWQRSSPGGAWWDSPSAHVVVGRDNIVYAYADLYSVAARNAEGKLLWTDRIPQHNVHQGWLTALAVGPNGTLYAGTSEGRIYAFSHRSPALEWEFDSPETVIRLVPLGAGTVAAADQRISRVGMDPQRGASVIAVGPRNAYAQAHLPRSDRLRLYSAMLTEDYYWNEWDLAREVIGMAQKSNPPPVVPRQVYEELGEAQEDLREGQCDKNTDALNAVRKLAPWWGPLYKAMADAQESPKCGGNASSYAVNEWKLYLRATPHAPDRDQIEEKIGALTAGAANARAAIMKPSYPVTARVPAAVPAPVLAPVVPAAPAQPVTPLAVSQGVVTPPPRHTGIITVIDPDASCGDLLSREAHVAFAASMFTGYIGTDTKARELREEACASDTYVYTSIAITGGWSYAVTARDAIQAAHSWRSGDSVQVYFIPNKGYCAEETDYVLDDLTRHSWLCASF